MIGSMALLASAIVLSNFVNLCDSRLLFKVDADANGVVCSPSPCTAAFAGRTSTDYGVRRDGETSNYFIELRNTAGQDSQARVDVNGFTLPNATRMSMTMWVRLTNYESMRTAPRFVTNQREFINSRNATDRTFYTFFGPFQNARSAFGNSVDLRARVLSVNESVTPNRNVDLEARANNRILFPNRWHHVAFTYNNGTLIVYLDTANVGRIVGAGITRIVAPSGAMSIGAVAPGPVPMGLNASSFATSWDDAGIIGHLDDIRLYDDTLTVAELTSVYFGYEPGFPVSSKAPEVYTMPPWLMDISAANQTRYRNVFRQFIAPGTDNFWKVTTSAAVAGAFVRGNPFNESLVETATMPFTPNSLVQEISPINEYYLMFEFNFTSKTRPTSLPGRQFSVGLAHNNTLLNFNGTTNRSPSLLCRTFTLSAFGGDSAYPVFQSWAQFDFSQCRASNMSSLVRLAIKFAIANDSSIDTVIYEFISDPYEEIQRNYSSFVLPFASTNVATLPSGGTGDTTVAAGNSDTIGGDTANAVDTSTTTTLRDLGTTFNSSIITPLQATEFVGIHLALLIAGVLLGCTLLAMFLLKIRRRLERRTVHRSNRNSIALTRHEAIELDRHITHIDLRDRLDRTMHEREMRTVQSAPNLGGSMQSARSGRFGQGSTLQTSGNTLESSGSTMLARSAPRNVAFELDDDEAVDPKFI